MIGRIGTSAALLALATLSGCAERDDAPREAIATFERFQRALQDADVGACRELLTVQSAEALAEMPWQDLAEREPLEVVAGRRDRNGFRVEVIDPNQNGERGEFVVVREYGKLVVDLVATAGLTAKTVEASHSREQFTPRALTAEDYDRIRKHELSQAPR